MQIVLIEMRDQITTSKKKYNISSIFQSYKCLTITITCFLPLEILNNFAFINNKIKTLYVYIYLRFFSLNYFTMKDKHLHARHDRQQQHCMDVLCLNGLHMHSISLTTWCFLIFLSCHFCFQFSSRKSIIF